MHCGRWRDASTAESFPGVDAPGEISFAPATWVRTIAPAGCRRSKMVYLLVALALALHVAFWGFGLARLAMPAPWRRFWPVLILPAGFALQSAVVWAAAMAGFAGTRTYGWATVILPLALAVVAVR